MVFIGVIKKAKLTGTVAVLATVLLCLQMLLPMQAQAYFELGGPYISFGSGSVNVDVGNQAGVSCQINPIQEQQMKGCGIDYCPQKCNASCLVNGWCRCDGETYYTYYTTVSVSSSNTSVAGASWANGMLTVYGNGAGTATITVSTALDKHVGSSASITVNVTQPTYGGGGGNLGGNAQGGGGTNVDNSTGSGDVDLDVANSVSVISPGRRTADGVQIGVALVDDNLAPFALDGLDSTSQADLDLLGLSTVTATMAGMGVPLATDVIQRPLLMPTPVPLIVTVVVFAAIATALAWLLAKKRRQSKAAQSAVRIAAREAIKRGFSE